MGSFDAKKPPSKISCLGTFKPIQWRMRHSGGRWEMITVLAHGFQLCFAVYMYISFSSRCSKNLTVVIVNTGIIFNTIKNILHSYITFIPETPGSYTVAEKKHDRSAKETIFQATKTTVIQPETFVLVYLGYLLVILSFSYVSGSSFGRDSSFLFQQFLPFILVTQGFMSAGIFLQRPNLNSKWTFNIFS